MSLTSVLSRSTDLLSRAEKAVSREAEAASAEVRQEAGRVGGALKGAVADGFEGLRTAVDPARDVEHLPAQQPASLGWSPSAPGTPADLSGELDRLTGTHATDGNRIETYVDGENALPHILQGLDSAKSTLYYETYQLNGSDPVASQVVDKLIAARQRGVTVRVVVDAAGSRELPPFHQNPMIEKLKAADVDVQVYDPVDGLDDITHLSRDHRKTIVIDGQTAFLGGMNTGETYMGPASTPGRLHDVFGRIQGPAVKDLSNDFLDSWQKAGGAPVPASERDVPAPAPNADGVRMRIIPHVPGQDSNIRQAYLALINDAQKQINLENPFPLSSDVVDALAAAARRGVEVRYIVGSGQGLLNVAARKNDQQLLDAGVHIYVYPEGVHTKSMSIDGQVCTFGSSNMDNLSLTRNREIISLVEDPAFTQRYDQQLFDRDVVGDPCGRKTLELPRNLHESLWQRLETAVLTEVWPDSFE